ncbi:hypothetical protein MUU53_20115 [Rhizobium lemnae]|uniref:Uncharacterized protein n=1 Tax=Rhizobium lemnae TaxID=1214924 RepID=A0ABV8E6R3_9HYPH|nr:hypothetical protein [Rhizobium lemnae]MCJ8510198.1 hypothetical protein [Rhizobium lemnae]
MAKTSLAQSVAAAESEQGLTPASSTSPSSQAKVAAYVDPLVSKRQPSTRQPSSNAKTEQTAQQQTAVPQKQAESAANAQAPQNSLANVIQQPTAVQAGQNSIFAIANAKVAEAQGVPAYAPVKNINPMAGSVFSARNSGVAQPAPGSGSPNNNGLW